MSDAVSNALRAEGPPLVAPSRAGMNKVYETEGLDLDEQKALVEARKRFDAAIQAESTNRQKAVLCLRFKSGDQWEPDLAAERAAARRPKLTINKIPTFTNQVVNDQRMNRPGINISPTGRQGNLDLAHGIQGWIRAIERDSDAELAYDTAFESAADIGWGYWRYITEYAADDTFQQRLVCVPIPDTLSVYMDPDAQSPEGKDAKWVFLTSWVTNDEFKRDYPGVPLENWDTGGEGDRYRAWGDDRHIRVAEYFEVCVKKRTLVMLGNGHTGWEDELSDQVHDLSKAGVYGYQVIDERKVDYPKIMWRKMIANKIIDEAEWIGSTIPVVRTIWERVPINGKFKYSGIIERMLDPQRMYNYWSSSETESLALAPKAPWVIAEGQDEGYEDEFERANIVPNPVVHYRQVSLDGNPAPPPRREAPPAVPAGFVTAKQGAAADMMAVSGIRFDATPQERNYDESGKALRELQRVGDLGTFHGIDNLSRALRRGGEIMLEILPKLYDTAQIVTILSQDDSEKMVRIDPNHPQPYSPARPAQGQRLDVMNPTIGKFSVTVTTGPSFKTRRIEAAESMMQFVRALPQAGALIMDLIAKNLDWPGAEEIAARLAKALPPNMITPDQKDMSPQVQALLQSMQQQLQQAATERQGLIKQLTDKQADRAVAQDKIEKDFEAKLISVVQKAESAYSTHVGSQLKDLAEGVKMLHDRLGSISTGTQANNG